MDPRYRLLRVLLVLLAAQGCHAQAVSREEMERRIGFANKQFVTRFSPGSRTDRGRVYITLGPPDQINDVPEPPRGDTFPRQEWTYRTIFGIGTNVCIEFVDPEMNYGYRMTSLPCDVDSGKNAQPKRRFKLIQKRIRQVIGAGAQG